MTEFHAREPHGRGFPRKGDSTPGNLNEGDPWELVLDFDGVDDDGVEGTVVAVGGHPGDLVNDFAGVGIDDLTEDRVAAVEVGGLGDGDEEL